MTAFCLPNLVSERVEQQLPWFVDVSIPEEVRRDKQARARWLTQPGTKHCCYSFVEGVNPWLRVTTPKEDGSGNPAHALHGLVADYDRPTPEEEVLARVEAWPVKPQFLERTLSGNWRAVWPFETPVKLPSHQFLIFFLKQFEKVAFKLSELLPGFDRPAFLNPGQYYSTSGDWFSTETPPLSVDLVTGWVVAASQRYGFTEMDCPEIPLEEVAKALRDRYPRFSEWPGEFKEGARGPSFWVEGSTSPNSAVVRTRGMQTFASHATRGFYTWADLLGRDYTRQWEAQTLGQQVRDVWFDGRHYWVPTDNGRWRALEKADAALFLKVKRGVSAKVDKSGNSDLDRALVFIQHQQRVARALPLIFQPSGPRLCNGELLLNTAYVVPLAPAEQPTTWGPDGGFPWLSRFFTALFGGDEEQLNVLMAWTQRAYAGFYRQQPVSGQVLFLVGPVGIGKTLLSRGVLGPLFGGYAEAGPFLMGEDSFNAELFNVGLWCVDDTEAATDTGRVRRWTAALKRASANPSFRFHEKFRTAGLVEWCGRLVVTCNNDEESILLLPDMTASVADKLILLRVTGDPEFRFPSSWEIRRTLQQELPFFARWLLDWTPPGELLGDARFGIKAFAEETLYEIAMAASSSSTFASLLETWANGYFGVLSEEDYWEGSGAELYRLMSADGAMARLLNAHSWSLQSFLRRLRALSAREDGAVGVRVECVRSGFNPRWRVYRPAAGAKPKHVGRSRL